MTQYDNAIIMRNQTGSASSCVVAVTAGVGYVLFCYNIGSTGKNGIPIAIFSIRIGWDGTVVHNTIVGTNIISSTSASGGNLTVNFTTNYVRWTFIRIG